MFPKRFSATVLYVILVLAVGARPADAAFLWLYDYVNTPTDTYTMGIYSAQHNPVTPESLVFGTVPAPGAVGEVAVTQAVIGAGQQVPLPVFSDGAQATEAEVFWTAHLWIAHFGQVNITEPQYRGEDRVSVSFDGLTCTSASVVINKTTGTVPVQATDVDIMVTVVGFRPLGSTAAGNPAWGAMKSRYRGERGASRPAPQDR